MLTSKEDTIEVILPDGTNSDVATDEEALLADSGNSSAIPTFIPENVGS